jgi:hypothetical protein
MNPIRSTCPQCLIWLAAILALWLQAGAAEELKIDRLSVLPIPPSPFPSPSRYPMLFGGEPYFRISGATRDSDVRILWSTDLKTWHEQTSTRLFGWWERWDRIRKNAFTWIDPEDYEFYGIAPEPGLYARPFPFWTYQEVLLVTYPLLTSNVFNGIYFRAVLHSDETPEVTIAAPGEHR